MILRIDDTDVERNTAVSETSIFEGLKWLELDWDEEYRQSERLDLHRRLANAIFEKGLAYRDFTPAAAEDDRDRAEERWLFNPEMRALSAEESDRRAAAGEPFVLRYRVPRETPRAIEFRDAVYGEQSKSTEDIEDFALLRSNGLPTYHMASCADDADLRISHIVRGQDHLTNTFKHLLIFEALETPAPQFAHLPLLIAPDGSKLSKRKHGPVVSVTTYRDAGFLSQAFVNFVCLLGWNPKDDRTQMSRQELVDAFSFEGVNRANAVVNFREDDPFDPKAVWLNAQHIMALSPGELADRLLPFARGAGFQADRERMLEVVPLIRERIKTLRDVATAADFIFLGELAPYDPADLIPQKGDAAMARAALESAEARLAGTEFAHDALEAALREEAGRLHLKAGQMFQPIRVAVCGRKNAPPLFATLEVVGRDATLRRIRQAIEKLGEPSHANS